MSSDDWKPYDFRNLMTGAEMDAAVNKANGLMAANPSLSLLQAIALALQPGENQ